MKNKTVNLAYIALAAALIAICAWISIPLPTGIPVTLQTLGVCAVAGILGAKRGTAAVAVYTVIGLIGVPVFSGFRSGPAILFGSTGGYIFGFLFTALIIGFTSDMLEKKVKDVKKKPPILFLSMLLGIFACYVLGTIWFAAVWAKTNEPAALSTILGLCVFPYIVPDIVKALLAASIAIPVRKINNRFN